MTKQEICRAISCNLEPKPVRKPTHRINGVAVDIQGQWSKMGFWEYSYGEGWIPDDYFESEDASARLLDAMPIPHLDKYFRNGDPSTAYWKCEPDVCAPRNVYSEHTDRKTAIVLAAMKQLGIEGEISE